MEIFLISLFCIAVTLIAVAAILMFIGSVRIGEDEVGIVIKKFALPFQRSLPSHQQIALNGESGYQADTLSPGPHWGYWPWIYSIRKEPLIKIPPGEIALVVAKDGEPIPRERLLGRSVECNNFQNARAFLTNGGQQGRQLDILTTGEYRINTALFDVITAANADPQLHGVHPEQLRQYKIEADKIGVVTTYDGAPLVDQNAGPVIQGHFNFQNGQKFIDGGGCKGLQEEFIPAGAYQLNPWFVKVEQVSITNIPPEAVGVVVSYVGKIAENRVGDGLVEPGYKGIWKDPLYTGRYSINTHTKKVIIVPTHQITLDWSSKKEKLPTNYDAQLHTLQLRSKDGFSFGIEVTQIIRIDGENAPKMVSRVVTSGGNESKTQVGNEPGPIKYSSIRNLVNRVLEPTIGNYFRNSAQDYGALDFHENRRDRQREAIEYIETALSAIGVQAVDTLIHEIDLPDELEKILQERKIEEEIRINTLKKLENTKLLEELARANAMIRMQEVLVAAEIGAKAKGYTTLADADEIRQKILAEIEALGSVEAYLAKIIREKFSDLKLPNTLFDSGGITRLIERMLGEDGQQKLLSSNNLELLLGQFVELIKERPELIIAMRPKSLQDGLNPSNPTQILPAKISTDNNTGTIGTERGDIDSTIKPKRTKGQRRSKDKPKDVAEE